MALAGKGGAERDSCNLPPGSTARIRLPAGDGCRGINDTLGFLLPSAEQRSAPANTGLSGAKQPRPRGELLADPPEQRGDTLFQQNGVCACPKRAHQYLHTSRKTKETPQALKPYFAPWLPTPNHRITAWQGLEGTSVGHLIQPPAQAGSPRAGCTAPRPGGS